MALPKGDVLGRSKEQFEATIGMALGGRVAEELFFNRLTTGASDDIKKATQIARAMVCEYGMSKLGPLSYGGDESSVFLGRDYNQRSQDYSEQTAREIDQETRRIIEDQHEKVKTMLGDKRHLVESLAKALLERETLDSEELQAVYEGRELPPRQRVVIPTYADKERQKADKRKAASIFGGPPKPATS